MPEPPAGIPADSSRAPGVGTPAVGAPSLEALTASGPISTPYDESPVLLPGEWLSDLLSERLVPVLTERRLPPDTSALIWVLIGPDGGVAGAVLHTTSGHDEFDRAALQAATELRYRPARLAGSPVPVWIIADVSVLLR
ncbi:MAG: TonB family protein [Gemmatimonadota bacterium]